MAFAELQSKFQDFGAGISREVKGVFEDGRETLGEILEMKLVLDQRIFNLIKQIHAWAPKWLPGVNHLFTGMEHGMAAHGAVLGHDRYKDGAPIEGLGQRAKQAVQHELASKLYTYAATLEILTLLVPEADVVRILSGMSKLSGDEAIVRFLEFVPGLFKEATRGAKGEKTQKARDLFQEFLGKFAKSHLAHEALKETLGKHPVVQAAQGVVEEAHAVTDKFQKKMHPQPAAA